MPVFRVGLSKRIVHTMEVYVEADNPEEAMERGSRLAETKYWLDFEGNTPSVTAAADWAEEVEGLEPQDIED